jgi:putative MATE family efflux protein
MALTRDRRKEILTIALPIVGSMVSQNILNLVDTAMVGSLGNAEVGAVSMASFASFVSQAFITGLSVGVQAMSARRHGEGNYAERAIPLNGGLMLALLIGLPLSILIFWFAPDLFPMITRDPELGAHGGTYLRWRSIAIVSVGMNFAFRGYWNGISQSHIYFRTIVAMHAGNIVLNWALIFGHLGLPEMGVQGAALGTAISTWLGTLYYMLQGLWLARDNGFLQEIPSFRSLWTMLRTAAPAGLQNFFFAAGLLVFAWMVEKMGTAEAAANGVLTNLLLVLILPAIAFGLASGSLVGQALGRKDPDDAEQWAWDVSKLAVAILVVVATVIGIFAPQVIDPFLKDDYAAQLAVWPLRLVCLTIAIDATGLVIQNSLLGAGDSRIVMYVSSGFQWFFLLPLAYLLGPVFELGLFAVWCAFVLTRVLQTGAFVIIWKRGAWKSVEV